MPTVLETQHNFSMLLGQVRQEGEVRIQRADGQTFVLKPENIKGPALDVAGVDLGISTPEIVEFIHNGRREF